MRLPIATAVSAAILLSACSQTSQNATPKTEDEKALYSMGVIVGQRFGFESLGLTDAEFKMLLAGLSDGSHGKSKMTDEDLEKIGPKIQELVTKKSEAHMSGLAAKAKEEGTAYLAKAEKESGAVKLPNGVIVKTTQEGTGAMPTAADTVKVTYEGKLVSGKVFDATAKHPGGGPDEFPLAGVVPCWSEGFQKLKVGAKAQLTCPSDTAYGEQGRPPEIPGNSVLVFDVELLEIVKPADAPAAGAPKAK